MDKYRTCCAFTGHRPNRLPWKYNGDRRKMCGLESNSDRTDHLGRCRSGQLLQRGGTDGVDYWAALIVLDLRKTNPVLRLHCVLPHGGQADRWSESAQKRYRSILDQANTVEHLSHEYYDGCMLD